jgi:hypothetical protein
MVVLSIFFENNKVNYYISVTSMLSAPRSRAEQLIYQRRAQEDKLVNMQTKLKQEFHQSEFAKWQNKGKNIEINNQVRQKLAALRQASQANLQQRRYQLRYSDKNWLSSLPIRMQPTNKKSFKCKRHQNRPANAWLEESKSSKKRSKKEESKKSTPN